MGIREARAIGAAAVTAWAKSGPTMICAPLDRLADGRLGALRRAAVVLDDELHVGIAEIGPCHLGGIAHRLGGGAAALPLADKGRMRPIWFC